MLISIVVNASHMSLKPFIILISFKTLKKKIFLKSRDPPVATLNKNGELLTNRKDIEDRAVKVYTERLKPNKIVQELELYQETENKLCEMQLKMTKLNRTEP